MNNTDFTQPGGFPMDQQVFNLLQDNAALAGNAAILGGNLCILKGCVVGGGNASNGVVSINGEPLPFVGAAITAKVIIVETTNNLVYEDGNAKGVEKIRYATFGDDGVTNYLWADFKRNDPTNGVLARLDKLEMMLKPLLPFDMAGDTVHGCRLEWNKPAIYIPAGWIADDDEEVQGRMPVGYKAGDPDFGVIGATGGSKTHTLTVDEMPEHNHASGSKPSKGRAAGNSFDEMEWRQDAVDPTTPAFTADQWTRKVGGGQAHSILNPFRVVRYIKWVG